MRLSDEQGYALVNSVQADGAQAEYCHTDVSNDAEVAALVETAVETFGKVDVMLNTAEGLILHCRVASQ